MGIKLYIFHYHFLPGGVTDVIRMSAAALLSGSSDIDSIVLVSGRSDNLEEVISRIKDQLPQEKHPSVSALVIPEIDYLEKLSVTYNPSEMALLLQNKCGGGDAVWWVHNYHLGKNPCFTASLIYAADHLNQKSVFHIHDFPECSRYENLNALSQVKKLREEGLYLRHPNIRYAVINGRDYRYLRDAGLKEDELFLINNPVPPSHLDPIDKKRLREELDKRFGSRFPAFDQEKPLFFYPVRSIRRKNVLETGFLLRMLKNRPNLIVSLPGYSPLEKEYSDLVEKAFEEGLISGLWGIGAEEETEWISYKNLQRGCDAIVSGSVQEGFGYMFVNTLHWQKPLLARNLDIIDGFRTLFEDYPAIFYSELLAPLSDGERNEVREEYKKRLFSEKIVISEERKKELLVELETRLEKKGFDFSYLSPERQIKFLKRIGDVKNPENNLLARCKELNKPLLEEIEKRLAMPLKDKDREISELFGVEGVRETYKKVFRSFDEEKLSGWGREIRPVSDKLIIRFSEPEYLRLLYG